MASTTKRSSQEGNQSQQIINHNDQDKPEEIQGLRNYSIFIALNNGICSNIAVECEHKR